jgi:hypothetical protein
MSFAGILCACWLGIGGVAFLAFSGLGRLAARGDVEADLGIVGDVELRMLLGGRAQPRPSLEKRLAQFAAPGPQPVWSSSDRIASGFTGTSYTTSIGAGYTT